MNLMRARVVALLLLAAFVAPLLAPPAPAAQGGPIKIGFLAPLSDGERLTGAVRAGSRGR